MFFNKKVDGSELTSSSPPSEEMKLSSSLTRRFPRPLREGKSYHRPHELILRETLSSDETRRKRKGKIPPAKSLSFRNLSLHKTRKKKRYPRRRRQPKLPSISRNVQHPTRSVLESLKSVQIPVSFLRNQNQPHVMIASGCEILELLLRENDLRRKGFYFQKWHEYSVESERRERENVRKRNEKWWGTQRLYTMFRDIYRYHIHRGFYKWYVLFSLKYENNTHWNN